MAYPDITREGLVAHLQESQEKIHQLNKENLALDDTLKERTIVLQELDDELKTCKKERSNCEAAWEEQQEKIAILEAKLVEKQHDADTWYRLTKEGDCKYASLEIDYNECKEKLRYVENLAVRRGTGE